MANDLFDTEFDEEIDALLGLVTDEDELEGDDDAAVPKARVQALVRKRLEKAQRSAERKIEDFKAVYGVTPDEAIALANAKAGGMGVVTPQIPARPAAAPTAPASVAWNPNDLLNQAPSAPAQGARDPRVDTLEQRVMQLSQEKQLEAEALEFSRVYAGVTFDQIPIEVRKRREAGGVTLLEAMNMYVGATADTRAAEARKQGADGALRNVQRNNGMFSEGTNLAGTQPPGEVAFIQPEDKDFINGVLGMSDKKFLQAQQRAKKYKEMYGIGQ